MKKLLTLTAIYLSSIGYSAVSTELQTPAALQPQDLSFHKVHMWGKLHSCLPQAKCQSLL
ncbi:hypothetical protein [Simkania negevensis]|uniref:hypothetical protein n=1 Tax=Simkania negevensis TaxID=83561 RepID=UPI0011D2AB05|nr:hypothetical protein [Simkania negevensis]